MLSKLRIFVLAAAASALFSACGGGGDGDGASFAAPPGNPAQPDAFSATADATNTRELALSWTESIGANLYRVKIKRSDLENDEVLADNIDADTRQHIVSASMLRKFSLVWTQATVKIEACNAAGCTEADPISLDAFQEDIVAPNSYLKGDGIAASVMGRAVAISDDGNVIAVGSPGYSSGPATSGSGAVFVYPRNGAPIRLLNPTPAANDGFGTSIALSADGSVLAVGAPLDDAVATDAGAVHIYNRVGATWVLQLSVGPGLTQAAGVQYGQAIAISRDATTLAIGAPFDSQGNVRGGSVYILAAAGAGWNPQAKITNNVARDYFGWSISLSANGNVMAVGGPSDFDPVANPTSPGFVWTYTRTNGAWGAADALLTPLGGTARDQFGISVDLSADGNTLAVSAYREDGDRDSTFAVRNELATNSGAVYVYQRTSGGWSVPAYLKASNAAADDFFGLKIALSRDGSTLAIGAPQADGAGDNAGAAYIFAKVGGSWLEHAYITAPSAAASDAFGFSIALSGDGEALVVGAPGEDGDVASTLQSPNDFSLQAGAVFAY